ncbi:hypothetical protein ABI59_19895 [Acidobacteria bacterium Mor1]|nr:hypothetical protein ABI59_19895 [Acidobacteria bacterium Mor1]
MIPAMLHFLRGISAEHAGVAVLLALLTAPAAADDGASPWCRLDLRGEEGPRASPSCTTGVFQERLGFGQADRFADSDGDGWPEVVLELDLDPAKGFSCAVFRVHYAESPQGFTVNIGDSSTNDGYGGDAGSSPKHSAEMQVNTQANGTRLSVFSSLGPPPDHYARTFLPDLAGHFLELEVCHQFLGYAIDGDWESPGATRMKSIAGQRLFFIAPAGQAGEGAGGDPWIHAAFNRVIHRRTGAPSGERTGKGVSKVELRLTR